jgi:hypothetical protein
MQMNAQVGRASNANGSTPTVRAAREGELVVTQNHGRYYQKVAENDAVVVSTPLIGVTLAATHTVATLGATATPVITLMNGGAFNIAINREYIATLSGTPAAGSWWWMLATGQQPSALTLLTDGGVSARNLIADTPSGLRVGVGKALTGLTGNLVPYKPVGAMNTVTAALGVIDRDTDGAIILSPGMLLALMAPAAGTTHIVHASLDITKIEA